MGIGDSDNCPHCDAPWKGEDIFEYFMTQKTDPKSEQHAYFCDKSDEEIYESARAYGYKIGKPVFFRHVIGVQLEYNHPQFYDGISYWQCPACKETWNRFSGKQERIADNPYAKPWQKITEEKIGDQDG
jgi:Zn-finger nucleic acid-binding protein